MPVRVLLSFFAYTTMRVIIAAEIGRDDSDDQEEEEEEEEEEEA